ncbi:MAG: hypothetical protein JXA22_04995 [Candidatus Thermoplasmatota archaeon]|nr:hypothetical protein [Candidatus Thermoplasmatota archaeon]
MLKVFLNRTFIFFQATALLLFIMMIVLIIAITRMVLWQQCLMSSCAVPFYMFVLMIYIAGTLLSPYKIEVHDSSVSFHHFLRSRTENIPYNRIKEIEIPRGERSLQIQIIDDHGYEHRFFMVRYRISREIIARHQRYIKKHKVLPRP